ncbi:MAG: phasin family protein [Deltaproteobacteria bacterium]|nr:phasin family protein [bacterium]MCB9479766.1 phasin family protein [Deltaproteobacteria bacterium]MCB9487536.1 phasin family protein [Deltaproteobacteria bacterium]
MAEFDIKHLGEKLPESVKKFIDDTTNTLQHSEAEVRTFVTRWVEKGKLTPAEGQKILADFRERVNKGRVELDRRFEESTARLMARVNLPTKNEVEKLNTRVNSLSKRVSTLKKQLAA